MKKTIIIFLLVLLACNWSPPENKPWKEIVLLSDTALTGTFSQTDCYPDCASWYKTTRYTILYFDGTNKFMYYEHITEPTTEKSMTLYFEIYVEMGQYKTREWISKHEEDWTLLENYSLIGNTLTLTNFLGENYTLTR